MGRYVEISCMQIIALYLPSPSFPPLLSSLVVTGASEGIGRGYALEVGILSLASATVLHCIHNKLYVYLAC